MYVIDVLIDDCWQAPARDPKTSAPLADPERFPKGLGWLVDEIHGLGMKAGIYSSAVSCPSWFGLKRQMIARARS
jgi:alpha-galactosidase